MVSCSLKSQKDQTRHDIDRIINDTIFQKFQIENLDDIFVTILIQPLSPT